MCVCLCSVTDVRKDIECVFGIMKKTFRILKLPFEIRKEGVGVHFRVCCVLHNMLLKHDGSAEIGAEEEHYIRQQVSELTKQAMEGHLSAHPCARETDYTKIGAAVQMDIINAKEDKAHFEALRSALVVHYVVSLIRGGIARLRTVSSIHTNTSDVSSEDVA